MFNVGGGEVIVLLLLALLLLGPEKLPEAARKVGKLLAEFRRITTGFQEEVRSAMDLGPSGKVADLLDSTTPGPTLSGPAATSGGPEAPSPPSTPPSGRAKRPATGAGGAFVADLSPVEDTDGSSSGDR